MLFLQFAAEASYHAQMDMQGVFFSCSHDLEEYANALGLDQELALVQPFCLNRGVYYPQITAGSPKDTKPVAKLRSLEKLAKTRFFEEADAPSPEELTDLMESYIQRATLLMSSRVVQLSKTVLSIRNRAAIDS